MCVCVWHGEECNRWKLCQWCLRPRCTCWCHWPLLVAPPRTTPPMAPSSSQPSALQLLTRCLVTKYYKVVDFSLWPLVGCSKYAARPLARRTCNASVEIIKWFVQRTDAWLDRCLKGTRRHQRLSNTDTNWLSCACILFCSSDHFYAIFMQFQYKS